MEEDIKVMKKELANVTVNENKVNENKVNENVTIPQKELNQV
jgi:hypothetical protein